MPCVKVPVEAFTHGVGQYTKYSGRSGIKYELAMNKPSKIVYERIKDGEELYVDLRSDPAGGTTGYF